MLKSVDVSHGPQGKLSRLESLPPELINTIYSRFVPVKDYMRGCRISQLFRQTLMQGPSWQAHAHDLLPGLEVPNIGDCKSVIREQHAIRAKMSKGTCETIGVMKHSSEIKKVVFAEQPTSDGVYTLISASNEKVCVTYVGPNAQLKDGKSFLLVEDGFNEVMDLAVTADGKYVGLALFEQGALLLRTDALEDSSKYFAPFATYGEINLISFSPAGTHVITDSAENAGLSVWDVNNLKKPICEVSAGQTERHFFYKGLQFSPDGQSILAWAEQLNYENYENVESIVRLWPNWRKKPQESIIVQDPHHARTGQQPHYGPVVDACYSLDGTIVTASTDNTVNIYSFHRHYSTDSADDQHDCMHVKQIRDKTGRFGGRHSECGNEIWSAQLTDDNCFLLTMTKNKDCGNDAIQFWDMEAAEPRPRRQNKPDCPDFQDYTSLSRITRNNKYVAIGDRGGNVAIMYYGHVIPGG